MKPKFIPRHWWFSLSRNYRRRLIKMAPNFLQAVAEGKAALGLYIK